MISSIPVHCGCSRPPTSCGVPAAGSTSRGPRWPSSAAYCLRVGRFVASDPELPAWCAEAVDRWEEALGLLGREPLALCDRLDPFIKLALFDATLQALGRHWSEIASDRTLYHQLALLDVGYHRISDDGPFQQLEADGRLRHRLIADLPRMSTGERDAWTCGHADWNRASPPDPRGRSRLFCLTLYAASNAAWSAAGTASYEPIPVKFSTSPILRGLTHRPGTPRRAGKISTRPTLMQVRSIVVRAGASPTTRSVRSWFAPAPPDR